MKKNNIFIVLISGLILLSGCEEKQWQDPNVTYEPIYSVAYENMTLELYYNKLIAVLDNKGKYTSFDFTNYSDLSTTDKYNVSFSATISDSIKSLTVRKFTLQKDYSIVSDSIENRFISNKDGVVKVGKGRIIISIDTIEGAINTQNSKSSIEYSMEITQCKRLY